MKSRTRYDGVAIWTAAHKMNSRVEGSRDSVEKSLVASDVLLGTPLSPMRRQESLTKTGLKFPCFLTESLIGDTQ